MVQSKGLAPKRIVLNYSVVTLLYPIFARNGRKKPIFRAFYFKKGLHRRFLRVEPSYALDKALLWQ